MNNHPSTTLRVTVRRALLGTVRLSDPEASGEVCFHFRNNI